MEKILVCVLCGGIVKGYDRYYKMKDNKFMYSDNKREWKVSSMTTEEFMSFDNWEVVQVPGVAAVPGKGNEEKASVKLLDWLEEKKYYMLPYYPFNRSFDEVIADVYWNDEEEETEEIISLKNVLEKYSKWCLDNLELVEKENK